MTSEAAFVFVLIGVAAALMASNRVRFDVVALLVVLALILSGILSVSEALAGFGSSVVILVAGLLVVGEMLARTGVASAVGDWILKRGGSNETRLLILIMFGAGVLGAVMSSTAVVAIFIPIVLRIAAETKLNSSRMLLPMSYAALISGMITLIATTPNIVVHEELKAAGYEGFGFFDFTIIGTSILLVAIVYILLIGRWLLPADVSGNEGASTSRSIFKLWEDFRAAEDYKRLQLHGGSLLAGVTIAESAPESRFGYAFSASPDKVQLARSRSQHLHRVPSFKLATFSLSSAWERRSIMFAENFNFPPCRLQPVHLNVGCGNSVLRRCSSTRTRNSSENPCVSWSSAPTSTFMWLVCAENHRLSTTSRISRFSQAIVC